MQLMKLNHFANEPTVLTCTDTSYRVCHLKGQSHKKHYFLSNEVYRKECSYSYFLGLTSKSELVTYRTWIGIFEVFVLYVRSNFHKPATLLVHETSRKHRNIPKFMLSEPRNVHCEI